jgi:dynein heavy chain
MGDHEEEDVRFKYLFRLLSQAFRSIPIDKLRDIWKNEEITRALYEFLDNPDSQAVFFKEAKGTLEVYEGQVPSGKSQIFYLLKMQKIQVSESKISREIIYGDLSSAGIEHLAAITRRVYNPFVAQKVGDQSWSDAIMKEVRDHFDAFVSNLQITQGQMQGYTWLPLPHASLVPEDQEQADIHDNDNQYKSIHVLESALILWTKQIKNVLRLDPEYLFMNNAHPGPLDEVEFWKSKARHLNSIFDQLQSLRIRRILKVLDQSKSTYNAPFAKLCKEIFYARAEANNIIKFLRPLISWFEAMESESDYEGLVQHFHPIMYLILMVWKSSPYYNTPARLVIVMREICNSIIKQSSMYLNGDAIFELVEAGETPAAVKMLKTVISVCGRLKGVYNEYKKRAAIECPDNPWSVQNNAVFVRLDTFLERCHDILDFGQTIVMFTKLAKIEIGGTKGKTLTTSIAQIFSDFNQAIDTIRGLGKGILDLENKRFEEAFYEFRNRIKELDRRLSSIVVQGFEDASTVIGRFRLLDSFDTLISRPIVADALEKRHVALIEAIDHDLKEVQRIFDSQKESPTVPHNLPPIAGSLTWSKSLRDRIDIPINKLKTLDKKILDRDDVRDAIKAYTYLVGQISDFDRLNIESWGGTIEATSQTKLKNSLLGRVTSSSSESSAKSVYTLLKVNFDPLLVKLLREIKYFLLLGLEVPASAMDIYQKVEIFRRHTGNLDLIVNMYNDIQTTLLPVERPLVKAQLDRVDKTLSQGIGEGKNKAKALNWKSNGIDLFIGEAMTEVKEVNEILQMLKGNLKSVESTVGIWQTQPIFDRAYKTVVTIDFINLQKKTRQNKLAAVKEAGQEIHRLLKDTNKKLKVSQGLPDWKAYVDFINNVVVYGLADAMASSLRTMAQQFNPQYLDANSLPPLLEIQMDLVDKAVVFLPEVGFVPQSSMQDDNNLGGLSGPTTASSGVAGQFPVGNEPMAIKNIVMNWINGMLGLASVFKRLDSGEGTYLRELGEAPLVNLYKKKVMAYLNAMENNANKLRNVFRKFEYLWLTTLHDLFQEFLKEVVQIEYVPFDVPAAAAAANDSSIVSGTVAAKDASTGAASNTGATAPAPVESHQCWAKTTINLTKFGEKIKSLLEIQQDISKINTMHDIDFLKVNAQPVKQAISTWATKWLYVHTQYLQDFVYHRLQDLHEFVHTVNKGLDTPVEAGNRDALMTVLSHIHHVRKRMPEIGCMFDPMHQIVSLLKMNAIVIDMPYIAGQPALDYLEHAKLHWDNVVNKAFRVKEAIQPMQTAMLEGIRKEVKQFNANVAKFVKDFRLVGPFNWLENSNIRDAYTSLDRCQRQLVQLESESKAINDLEDLFELPQSPHGTIREIEQDLKDLKMVWDTVMMIDAMFSTWKNTLWAEIRTDDLMEETKKIQNQLKRYPKKARDWGVFKTLENVVKNMAICLPLVHDLHSQAMRDRHWKSLMVLTGVVIDRGPNFCLDDLLSLNLQYHVDAVSEIVEVANKELKIESKLNTIEEAWRKFILRFVPHRDSDFYIVAPPDEILETLEEHSLLLQSMAGMGKFVEFFREQVSYWQISLGEVDGTLKSILSVQRQWGSLESIFLGSADIRTQLPEDTKRFEAVDSEFKELIRDLQAKSGALVSCRAEGREQSLHTMHKELEKCEKALNEYLEIKKSVFPRFYFVSNAALLDILSNGNHPPKIMPHIGSVFDGVGDLELCPSAALAKAMKDDPDAAHGPLDAAKAMISKDGEIVAFINLFEMRGAVESWLNELVKCMQTTLKHVLHDSMADALAWDDVNRTREDWIMTVPAQIALVTSQIIWTEEVESAFEELESGQEDSMKKYNELCTARLEGLIRLVQGELSKGDRIKIITVITIDVHNRDIVTQLVQKKVENNVDFKWQSQLRYYWHGEDRNVHIRICDFSTQYSFEYTGNCGRLVITPLTDRCYVTLTVALRLMMGGAPAGPAGTGKLKQLRTYRVDLACLAMYSIARIK